jgi:uncharacterized membrane protein YdbT with pleckstrin-like domain
MFKELNMAKYTRNTLQEDERIVCVARLHWIIYARAMACALLALGALTAAYLMPEWITFGALTGASALGVLGLRYAVQSWWRQFTTEMAVTNKRIIYKRGFIWRRTAEMLIPRVESVFVNQSVLGRMLNYGSIHCRGVGESLEHLHDIADPVCVQNAVAAH